MVCSRSDCSGHDVLWPFSDLALHEVLCPTTGSHTLRGLLAIEWSDWLWCVRGRFAVAITCCGLSAILGAMRFRVPRPAHTPYGACLQSNGGTGCGLFAVGSQWP